MFIYSSRTSFNNLTDCILIVRAASGDAKELKKHSIHNETYSGH